MVSFQCHACGDVVKKPKLDQHRSRCHTGFDCIDCSTTFNTPADYKGHTQCISEAEKYQKSMYKGVKTPAAAPRNNYPPLPPAPTAPPGRQFGGRGGYGGGGGWGRPRTTATGANDTPLGTSASNSPAPTPAPTPKAPTVQQVAAPIIKAPAPAIVTEVQSSSSEKKKDKKRKATVGEAAAKQPESTGEPMNKKVKFSDDPVDPASVPLPASPAGDEKRKEKKSKKDKTKVKDSEKEGKKKDQDGDVEMSAPAKETKEKKSKKEKKEKTKGSGSDAESSEKPKKRKRKEGAVSEEADGAERATKKKGKKEDTMDVDLPSADVDDAAVKKDKKSKKEKEKRDKGEKKEKKSKRASSVSVQ